MRKASSGQKAGPAILDMSAYGAEDIMKLMGALEEKQAKAPRALVKALNEGNAKAERDCAVAAFLQQAKILDNQESVILGDAPAEVYIVSLAFDMTGEGALLDAGSEVFKKVSRTASRPLIISSTPLFHNIYD